MSGSFRRNFYQTGGCPGSLGWNRSCSAARARGAELLGGRAWAPGSRRTWAANINWTYRVQVIPEPNRVVYRGRRP